jgi:hypothetical protein
MSRWTHAACLPCYEKLHPGRTPHRLADPEEEPCCICGGLAGSGIYVRADPASTLCKGVHPDDEDD